jgi:hypothetical protein
MAQVINVLGVGSGRDNAGKSDRRPSTADGRSHIMAQVMV